MIDLLMKFGANPRQTLGEIEETTLFGAALFGPGRIHYEYNNLVDSKVVQIV